MSEERRTALITGASAGIGSAFARVFAEHGFDVVLTARRDERLATLAAELERSFRVRTTVLAADLADPHTPRRLFDETQARGIAVDALVNNAGYGLRGAFASTRWPDQANLLTVMATAAVHLCHLYLPGMIERGYGRIINVASVMGLFPGSPGMTLYSPVKSFLVQFSESLYAETAATGVHVTVTCPGYTHTEFQAKAGITDVTDKAAPSFLWMSAEDVARGAFDAAMAGKARHVPGLRNKIGAVFLGKLLPRRLVLSVVRRLSADLLELRS